MDVETHCGRPGPADLEAAREVYRAAFAQPPYAEPAGSADAFVERVERYAATREGFRLYLARIDGAVAGLVLALLARPGDWWRDQVAAALGPGRAQTVLGDAFVEVVHVAVDPGQQGQGTGSALMDAVRGEALAPRGVLSVRPDAGPARRLYGRSGWQVVETELRLGDAAPVLLLSRTLP